MINVKKTISLLLCAAMIFSFAACSSKGPQPVDPIPLPGPQEPEPKPEDPKPQPEDPTADLKLSLEEWPVIDGALAMIPYYEEMAARILDMPIEEARKHVLANNTIPAYEHLAEGSVDMIFCAPPSAEQTEYAKSKGVELESVQVLNSGFVFFVNKSNPVSSLTKEQLHDIYAGKITNWKEVGGNDEPVIAYQRGAGSGSQSGLYQHVISAEEVMEAPTEQKIGLMEGIIDAVASYDNASGAIGYSYYYYLMNMHYKESVKMIAIDGIYPTPETITSDLYPFISKTAAYFNANQPEDSVVRKIAAWCAGSAGKKLAEDLGYVPSGEHFEIPGYGEIPAKHAPYTFAVNNGISEDHVEIALPEEFSPRDFGASYIRLSGLKNAEIQDRINAEIESEIMKLSSFTYVPKTRNIKDTDAAPDIGYISCYVIGSFANLLSVHVSYQVSITTEDGQSGFVNDVFPMTFDLRTGNRIKVTDLFSDKSLGIKYMNSCVYDALAKNAVFTDDADHQYAFDQIMLAAPFRGVKEDQKFYLDQDGSIVLVFGPESPEFFNTYSYSTVKVPAGAMSDYNELFSSEESLYLNDAGLMLLPADTDENYICDDFAIDVEGLEKYGCRFSGHSVIGDHFSESQKAIAGNLRDNFEEQSEKIRNEIALAEEGNPDQINPSFYGSVEYSRFGNYLTISESYTRFIYAYWNSGDSRYFDKFERTYYCYKDGSDEPLLFVDVFADGADVRSILMDAMKKTLADSGVDITKPGINGLVESAAVMARSFGLGSTEMLISYEDLESLVSKYLPWEEEQNYYKYYSIRMIPYSSIGCDNLAIFN